MVSSECNYDLVSEDNLSSRYVFTEEDFQSGIRFTAKIVGKMDIPQPSHRNEIVAAMRRIRYDSKSQKKKKQRVFICISVDGISITYRRRKTKMGWWKEIHTLIYHHPIHRVFYVSHDSQDLKIFSYIAKDTITNTFMCIVFKSYNKNDAVDIVSVMGQAFEYCHKFHNTDKDGEDVSDHSADSARAATDTTTNSNTGSCSAANRYSLVDAAANSINDSFIRNKHNQIISVANELNSTSKNTVIDSINHHINGNGSDGNMRHPGVNQLIFLLQDQISQIQKVKLELCNLNKHVKSENISSELLGKMRDQHSKQNDYMMKHIFQISQRLHKIEISLTSPVHKSKSMNIPLTKPDTGYQFDLITRSSTYCYQNNADKSDSNSRPTLLDLYPSLSENSTLEENDICEPPLVPPRMNLKLNLKK